MSVRIRCFRPKSSWSSARVNPLCRVQLLLELDAQLLTDAFESIDVLLVLTLVLNLLLDTFENADGG